MKNHMIYFIALLYGWLIVSLGLAGCTKREEPTPVTPPSPVKREVVAATTPLATIGLKEKPVASRGPSGHAAEFMPQDQSRNFTIVFGEWGGGVAYAAQNDGKSYVVYNGTKGKAYPGIGDLAVSPDGRRIAYGALVDGRWRMVIDGTEGKIFDEVGTPVFSPDGRHVAYEAKQGEKWHFVVDDSISPPALNYYDKPVFSADSAKVVAIENTDDVNRKRIVVSDLRFAQPVVREFHGSVVMVNNEKTKVGAIDEVEGKKRVIEVPLPVPVKVKEGPFYDDIAFLSLGSDGASVAYCVMAKGKRMLVLNGKQEQLPDGDVLTLPVIRPDAKGIAMILKGPKGAFLHQGFHQDGTTSEAYDDGTEPVYSPDSRHVAYTARRGKDCFVVVDGKDGPAFDIVFNPHYSPDGRFLVYRARKEGKRFVVVADAKGTVLRQHPNYELVFDTVFTADGKSVAYGVKDGQHLSWKVERLQ